MFLRWEKSPQSVFKQLHLLSMPLFCTKPVDKNFSKMDMNLLEYLLKSSLKSAWIRKVPSLLLSMQDLYIFVNKNDINVSNNFHWEWETQHLCWIKKRRNIRCNSAIIVTNPAFHVVLPLRWSNTFFFLPWICVKLLVCMLILLKRKMIQNRKRDFQ